MYICTGLRTVSELHNTAWYILLSLLRHNHYQDRYPGMGVQGIHTVIIYMILWLLTMLGPDDPMTVFLWPLHPVHIPGLESDSGYSQHSSLCPDLGGLIDLLAQSGCSARDANTLGRQLFSGIRCQVCGLGSSGCQASLGSGGCADVQIMVYPGILDPSRIFGWQ